MYPSAIVITNCTNRKRVVGNVVTLSKIQLNSPLEIVARRWTKALSKAAYTQEAQNLYVGRSISEAKNVAASLGGMLYVVSAGLGLVRASEAISTYDLTVSEGNASLAPLLKRLGKSPADWWDALINARGPERSVRALVENHRKSPIFFALPASYLALIGRDLAGLTAQQASRIRIITSELGVSSVPLHLRPLVLPYDERLEGSAYAGTRTDFPQRALRHFVEELKGHLLPLNEARAAVLEAMESMHKPVLPMRSKKSDNEILVLLRENWERFDGASGRLLRFLRDDALVACEQSRFRGLWLEVQEALITRD
jgi:hypothetical protein